MHNSEPAALTSTLNNQSLLKIYQTIKITLIQFVIVIACSEFLFTQEANATVPGFIPGEFSVDQSGAANYVIPLVTPPGTAGMQPSLSLSYNSLSGNALVGLGWTLGGLSTITRCGTTITQDGFIDGVDFDVNDRFCIEGQRLISINGVYGADNTEYRTELDGFTKVISYDTDDTNSGPEQFKVWTKSGQIIEYGYTIDSRIEAQGKADVRLWAVNKISDTVGNYLTVTYTEDNANGDYQPDRIDYTGNDSAALTPYASVQFVYEARNDHTKLYFSGSIVQNTERLKNIQTYVGATLVKDYQLAYEDSITSGRSRLISISECDINNACLGKTRFVWRDEPFGGISEQNGSWGSYSGTITSTSNFFNWGLHDLSGDGQADFVYRKSGSSGLWVKTVKKGNLPSLGSNINWGNYSGTPANDAEFFNSGFNDVSGDGLLDFIYRKSGSPTLWVMRNTGTEVDPKIRTGR